MGTREDLKSVSEQLQNSTQTRNICDSMIKTQAIKIIEVRELKEGEKALELIINGELVGAVIDPVIQLVNQRKEKLLAKKEQLLNAIEDELKPKE